MEEVEATNIEFRREKEEESEVATGESKNVSPETKESP